MKIVSAKWVDDEKTSVRVNGVMSVPFNDMGNRHTKILREWVDNGGVIEDRLTPAERAIELANRQKDAEKKAALNALTKADLAKLKTLASTP